MAFEYLINTVNGEATMQLCAKLANLIEDIPDDNTYKTLKAFYALRSKVIHGLDKISENEKNLGIIDFTERCIQNDIISIEEKP